MNDSQKPENEEPPIVIDCKDAGWDDALYDALPRRRHIELKTLHSSYDHFCRQLAAMFDMEFIEHFSENRGEFRRRK